LNVGAVQASNLQGPAGFCRAALTNEVVMNEQTKQHQNQSGEPINRNDPAIDPQVPGQPAPTQQQGEKEQAQSADPEVDQKQKHTDNDNEFSPGFEPQPDRAKPGEETDADIDTDGG
jgi:hypothetical protein